MLCVLAEKASQVIMFYVAVAKILAETFEWGYMRAEGSHPPVRGVGAFPKKINEVRRGNVSNKGDYL